MVKHHEIALQKRLSLTKRYIFKKKQQLFKKYIKHGKSNQEQALSGFVNQLTTLSKKLIDFKTDMVIKKAEGLIANHLTHEPRTVVGMTLKLLRNIAEHTDVEIKTHPFLAPSLKESLNHITASCASARKISVIEDNSLALGSLIINANKSIIDAQLSTQLKNAQDILLNGSHGTAN